MAQEYLPAPSNVRLADLMKEHNISQPELAKEIGCSKSTISRFISGAKGTLLMGQGSFRTTDKTADSAFGAADFLGKLRLADVVLFHQVRKTDVGRCRQIFLCHVVGPPF